MKLSYFSRQYVARLRADAGTNFSNYGTDVAWLDDLAGSKPYIFESSQVVDPPPILVFGEEKNAEFDAENAKRIYSWLASLTPVLGMEERLWAYLTHCVFPDYMAARWPATGEKLVIRRYLFEGSSFAALSRNGIARLWWAGYLTRDASRDNPFELTQALFLRQDIQVSLLERSLGKCPVVRTAVLDFFRTNNEKLSDKAFGRRVQLLLKELNLLGGVAILDALPAATIQVYLNKVAATFSPEIPAVITV